MVDKKAVALDRVFRALASSPRREILRRVARERRTVTELSDSFRMSLAAVSKHVRVLEDARLIAPTIEGRLHWCRLDPAPLEEARASIDEIRAFWGTQLDGLERFLTGDAATRKEPVTRKKGARR
jgi:DNA-binding transcriptional ArsR family regulator